MRAHTAVVSSRRCVQSHIQPAWTVVLVTSLRCLQAVRTALAAAGAHEVHAPLAVELDRAAACAHALEQQRREMTDVRGDYDGEHQLLRVMIGPCDGLRRSVTCHRRCTCWFAGWG